MQPIVVRPLPDLPDAYEIVAGERRWRAAQMAGLHEVPVVVVEIDDKTSLEYAILENVQRADLNAIEEAKGYQRLMDEFGYSTPIWLKILGKSRPHLDNMIRFSICLRRYRVCLEGRSRPDMPAPSSRSRTRRGGEADRRQGLERPRRRGHRPGGPWQWPASRSPGVRKIPTPARVEQALEDVLGLAVTIDHRGQAGELRIRYKTLDQLDGLCRRLRDSTLS